MPTSANRLRSVLATSVLALAVSASGVQGQRFVEVEYDPNLPIKEGFNPDRAITFGAQTIDEMMLGFINWAPVEQHDWSSPVEVPSASSGSD